MSVEEILEEDAHLWSSTPGERNKTVKQKLLLFFFHFNGNAGYREELLRKLCCLMFSVSVFQTVPNLKLLVGATCCWFSSGTVCMLWDLVQLLSAGLEEAHGWVFPDWEKSPGLG